MTEAQGTKGKIKELRVLIGIPSRGQFAADMALSLVNMVSLLNNAPLLDFKGEKHLLTYYVHCMRSSMLYSLRQKIVDIAKDPENKINYLLFLDDDMVFPPSLIHEWVMADRQVIAANCPTRATPTYPTARNRSIHELKGRMVYSDVANQRFDKVWRVGTGVMMLRQDALQALPRPAFTPRWVEELNDYTGEDWAMVEHVEAAGIPVYIDHEMSLQIKHVGDLAFSHEMVSATRRVEAKVQTAELGIISPSGNVPDREAPEIQVVTR